MNLAKHAWAGLLLGGWALMFPVTSRAQDYSDENTSPPAAVSRSDWERRAVQPAHPSYQDPPRGMMQPTSGDTAAYRRAPAAVATGTAPVRQYRSGYAVRQSGYMADPQAEPGTVPMANVPTRAAAEPNMAAGTSLSPAPMIEAGPPGAYGDAVPMAGGCGCGGSGSACGCGGGGCGCGHCASGGETFCGDGCCNAGNECDDHVFAVFGGVHAFKLPTDPAGTGNFGSQEGFLVSGPFGGLLTNEAPREIGWEAGAQGTQSDFLGSQPPAGVYSNSIRNQFFGTVGVFRRPQCGGLQWGAVLDFRHDDFIPNMDFTQIRADVSLLVSEDSEVGFWGAFATNAMQTFNNAGVIVPFRPLNLYNVYFRRSFAEGGEARAYAGLTGQGDGLAGLELKLPLIGSLAMEDTVQYMLPKDGANVNGLDREGWNMMMNLVWYPGKSVRCVYSSPYQALLPVADNASFIIDNR